MQSILPLSSALLQRCTSTHNHTNRTIPLKSSHLHKNNLKTKPFFISMAYFCSNFPIFKIKHLVWLILLSHFPTYDDVQAQGRNLLIDCLEIRLIITTRTEKWRNLIFVQTKIMQRFFWLTTKRVYFNWSVTLTQTNLKTMCWHWLLPRNILIFPPF